MVGLRTFLVAFLSLFLLCFPVLRYECSNVDAIFATGDQSSHHRGADACHEGKSSCCNKTPCPDHSCCHFIIQSVTPYFALDSTPMESVVIFPQIFEMATSIFRPPPAAT